MESKSKIRFTYVDFIIIFAVIVVIAGAYLYLTKDQLIDNSEITFTVNMAAVQKEVADQIQPGTKVFDGNKNFELGELVAVDKQPAVDQTFNTLTGAYIDAPVPEKFELTLKIKNEGHVNENKILIGDYELFVGKQVYLKGKNYVGSGTIWKIEEVKIND